MKQKIVLAMLVAGLALPVVGNSQDLVIYPAKGQSAEQMEKDKAECYTWAKGQTGFDPMKQPTATSAPPQQAEPKSGVVKGAVRGALVGTAVGAIAGDAGKGAAIGAASGGLLGGMRRRDQQARQENAQQQWAQQQAANYQQQRAAYNKAFSACMEGRGYSVK